MSGTIGAAALWLLFGWLACAIITSYLSNRKGYGDKIGLAFGLLLTVIGVIAWIVWPAKPNSDWKVLGPFGRAKGPEAAVSTDAGDRPAPVG